MSSTLLSPIEKPGDIPDVVRDMIEARRQEATRHLVYAVTVCTVVVIAIWFMITFFPDAKGVLYEEIVSMAGGGTTLCGVGYFLHEYRALHKTIPPAEGYLRIHAHQAGPPPKPDLGLVREEMLKWLKR